MASRLLLSTEPVTWGWAVRRVSAASIVAVLVNYTTKDYITNNSLQIAAVGATAYAAPECLDFLLRWIKARGEAEVAKVTKRIPNGKKSKSKRKR
jgi:predicted nucleic acid-binding protein